MLLLLPTPLLLLLMPPAVGGVVTMVTVGVALVAGEGDVVRIGTGMRRVLVLEPGGSGEDSGLERYSKRLSLSSSSKEAF